MHISKTGVFVKFIVRKMMTTRNRTTRRGQTAVVTTDKESSRAATETKTTDAYSTKAVEKESNDLTKQQSIQHDVQTSLDGNASNGKSPTENHVILENTNIVEIGLFGDNETNNGQIEDNSRKREQLSDLTSKTGEGSKKSKGETMPIALSGFSNEIMLNWKSHEESLRKVLKMRVNREYFPKYKFCNKKICQHVILKCLERNEINRTKGMTLTEFLDVTSKAIVFQLFNDGRHVIQSNMRREYRSK